MWVDSQGSLEHHVQRDLDIVQLATNLAAFLTRRCGSSGFRTSHAAGSLQTESF